MRLNIRLHYIVSRHYLTTKKEKMQYSALLLLAVAATSVTASMRPHAIPVPRRAVEARQTDDSAMPTDTSMPDGSDDGDDGFGDDGSGDDGSDDGLGDDGSGDEPSSCDSAAENLVTDMPTAPADLDTFAQTYTGDDSCITVPASLTSDWDDYSSSVDAWYSESSDAVSSFLAVCTDYELDLITDICTVDDDGSDEGSSTSADAGGGAATAAATTTDDKSTATAKATATDKSSESSESKTASATVTATAGAAPAVRDVGIIGAVLAGALGAAIAL